MASTFDIYLYGMLVQTTAHLLQSGFPEIDAYGEIAETHRFVGGETGTAAVLLASWGHRVAVAGPYLGTDTRDATRAFLERRRIDGGALEYDPTFPGVEDLVIVAGTTRTVFGKFGAYFSTKKKRWSRPDSEAIERSDAIGLDPFFGAESEEVAEICRVLGKPWVTIDCPPDSPLHVGSAVTVVSGEYIRDHYGTDDPRSLLRAYADQGAGLTIFTFGAREMMFARRGEASACMPAYRVEVKSTLGAGDCFKAAVVHAVANRMEDADVVRFAAATAACVCTRFPMASNPPTLEEIQALCGA